MILRNCSASFVPLAFCFNRDLRRLYLKLYVRLESLLQLSLKVLQLFFFPEFENLANGHGELFNTDCQSAQYDDGRTDNLYEKSVLSITTDRINAHVVQFVVSALQHAVTLLAVILCVIF